MVAEATPEVVEVDNDDRDSAASKCGGMPGPWLVVSEPKGHCTLFPSRRPGVGLTKESPGKA